MWPLGTDFFQLVSSAMVQPCCSMYQVIYSFLLVDHNNIFFVYTTVTFFIHHLIGVDCFLFVAVMNNAAMNVCVQHSVGALLLHIGYIPRSEIVGHMIIPCLTF